MTERLNDSLPEGRELAIADCADVIFNSFLASQGSQRWQEQHFRYFHSLYPEIRVPKGREIAIFQQLRSSAVPKFLGIEIDQSENVVQEAYDRARALYVSAVPMIFPNDPILRQTEIESVPSLNLHARCKHAGTREKRLNGESAIGLAEFEHALAREAHDFSQIMNDEMPVADSETLLADISFDIIAKDYYYLCEHPGGRPRTLKQDLLPKTLGVAERTRVFDGDLIHLPSASFMEDRYASHILQLGFKGLTDVSGNGTFVLHDFYIHFYKKIASLLNTMIKNGTLPEDSKQKLIAVIDIFNHYHSESITINSLMDI